MWTTLYDLLTKKDFFVDSYLINYNYFGWRGQFLRPRIQSDIVVNLYFSQSLKGFLVEMMIKLSFNLVE